MADRRMFAKSVIEGDRFTALSSGAQALYMHLCLAADDDGFTNQLKPCINLAKTSEKKLNELIDHGFIYRFPTGVVIIIHWCENNYIRKDRYHSTPFVKEKNCARLTSDKLYEIDEDLVNQMTTQVSKGKVRSGKCSIGKVSEDDVSQVDNIITENCESFPQNFPHPQKDVPSSEAFPFHQTDEAPLASRQPTPDITEAILPTEEEQPPLPEPTDTAQQVPSQTVEKLRKRLYPLVAPPDYTLLSNPTFTTKLIRKYLEGFETVIKLTDEELEMLYADFGTNLTFDYVDRMIQFAINNNVDHYKSAYNTIRKWAAQDGYIHQRKSKDDEIQNTAPPVG